MSGHRWHNTFDEIVINLRNWRDRLSTTSIPRSNSLSQKIQQVTNVSVHGWGWLSFGSWLYKETSRTNHLFSPLESVTEPNMAYHSDSSQDGSDSKRQRNEPWSKTKTNGQQDLKTTKQTESRHATHATQGDTLGSSNSHHTQGPNDPLPHLQTVTIEVFCYVSSRSNVMTNQPKPAQATSAIAYEELLEEMGKLDIADLLLIHRKIVLR